MQVAQKVTIDIDKDKRSRYESVIEQKDRKMDELKGN